MDEDEEAVSLRLEAICVHVGSNFTERYLLTRLLSLSLTRTPIHRLCREKLLFSEILDAIKFICSKVIWAACWDKQVDNLRTNHRVCSPLPHLSPSTTHHHTGCVRPPRQRLQTHITPLVLDKSCRRHKTRPSRMSPLPTSNSLIHLQFL